MLPHPDDPEGSCTFWSNTSGQGRGREVPGPLSQPAQPVPSLVSSLLHSQEKSVWQSLPSSEPWQRRSLPEEPTTPGNGCLSLCHRARVSEGGPWEPKEDWLAPRLAPSAGVLGTSVAPRLGLAASSSSLEGTGEWQIPCNVRVSSRPLGSATAWPPVPTHQRPVPRAPSGAADPAAGPAGSRLCPSDCVPVVLAVSHGGSAALLSGGAGDRL